MRRKVRPPKAWLKIKIRTRRQLRVLLMELSRTGNANLSPELDGLRPSAPVPRIPQAGGAYLGLPFPRGGPHFLRTIETKLRRTRPHKRLPSSDALFRMCEACL
jgi:hypothetical protein